MKFLLVFIVKKIKLEKTENHRRKLNFYWYSIFQIHCNYIIKSKLYIYIFINNCMFCIFCYCLRTVILVYKHTTLFRNLNVYFSAATEYSLKVIYKTKSLYKKI